MNDKLGPRPEGFFNIRYAYTKDIDIFPTFLSNEAMTSIEGERVSGGRFEKGHLVVLYKNYRLGYWHFEDYLNLREKILNEQLKTNKVSQFKNSINDYSSEISKILLKYNVEFINSKNPNELSWETYKRVCDLYRTICTNSFTSNLLDKRLTDLVKEDLSKIVTSENKLEDSLLVLSRAPEANYVYTHDLEIIKILEQEYTKADIDNHIDKWCGLFGAGNITDKDELRKTALERIEIFIGSSSQKLNDLKEEIENQMFQAKMDIELKEKELGLSQGLKDKFKLLRDAIVLKETRKLALVRFSYDASNLLSNVSRLSGLSELEVRCLDVDEVYDVLINKKIEETKDILVKSKFGVIFVVKDGRTQRYYGDEFLNRIKEFKIEDEVLACGTKKEVIRTKTSSFDARAKIYSGMVSCRGKITAPVKIVMSNKDFDKIVDGDILVTPLTTPEYVRIFHKVKGMITFDGGGLTSHPATLSREYKIPAILGIKDLDGVLRDGDTVELDADNNQIKIL